MKKLALFTWLAMSCAVSCVSVGCATQDSALDSTKSHLLNGAYKISYIHVDGVKVATKKATLHIQDDRIYGNAGCNSYFVGVEIHENNINISHAGATKMMCFDEEANDFERLYLSNLYGSFHTKKQGDFYILSNDKMTITLEKE